MRGKGDFFFFFFMWKTRCFPGGKILGYMKYLRNFTVTPSCMCQFWQLISSRGLRRKKREGFLWKRYNLRGRKKWQEIEAGGRDAQEGVRDTDPTSPRCSPWISPTPSETQPDSQLLSWASNSPGLSSKSLNYQDESRLVVITKPFHLIINLTDKTEFMGRIVGLGGQRTRDAQLSPVLAHTPLQSGWNKRTRIGQDHLRGHREKLKRIFFFPHAFLSFQKAVQLSKCLLQIEDLGAELPLPATFGLALIGPWYRFLLAIKLSCLRL